MTIEISEELEKLIVDFCNDELNYHINESGCAEEYKEEIDAQLELLRLLGYNTMREDYLEDYKQYLIDTEQDTNENVLPLSSKR